MPIGDRDYAHGSHLPYCTCIDCANKSSAKWRDSVQKDSPKVKSAQQHRMTYRRKSSGALGAVVLTLAVIFIILILRLVIWPLWGNQIVDFFAGLSSGSFFSY